MSREELQSRLVRLSTLELLILSRAQFEAAFLAEGGEQEQQIAAVNLATTSDCLVEFLGREGVYAIFRPTGEEPRLPPHSG
jgi:hypothetical protein